MMKDKSALLYLSVLSTVIVLISCSQKPGGSAELRISANGRYFTDASGTPVFWQGDTQWELFHLFSADEAIRLLRERRKQGFNAVQVMAAGVFPEWRKMKGMEPWQDLEAWLEHDPLKPNETYFRRADSIVSAAEKIGITLVIGVYHAMDVDNGRVNERNVGPWAEWLELRYRNAGNVIWSLYPHANSGSVPVIRAAIRGIREGDEGKHLITLHPDPSPKSSSFLHAEPWLSFNTLQTWSTGFSNHDMVRADYIRTPAKPVVNGEARYEEEDGTTPLETRRAGYWACLAGGFYSYGHRDNWMSPRTWREWIGSPGSGQIRIMGDIFRSLTWWKLVPDPSVFEAPVMGNAAAVSADGDWIVVYLTGGASESIRLDRITASGRAKACWIDPLTGARRKIGTFGTSGTESFAPPEGWEDAVLLIEKEI